MRTPDIAIETLTALGANRVRSSLTVLGIVIGISSVIAMISLGAGASNSIQSSIQSLGSNLILVTPGASRGPGSFGVSGRRGSARTLTPEDAAAIQAQVQGVVAVAQEVSGRYQVTAKGTNTNTTVDGVSGAYADIRNVQIAEGSFVSDAQSNSLAKVAVIGPTTAADLITDGSDPVGQTIRIKNVQFTIIGETVAKGGSGFNNPDDMVYIPVMSAERFLAGSSYLTTIDVQADSAGDMKQVQNDVTSLLLQLHNISDPSLADFSTINQADIIASASSIIGTFTLFLGAVAGISLVVGGIGIMNMMLTTVTERTKEIGLRKAVGAKQADIRIQFLSEAVTLTLIGGIIGTALGWLIAFGVSAAGIVQTSVSLTSILLACGVSAAIGILFGYYPASRASKMNPIDALRYE